MEKNQKIEELLKKLSSSAKEIEDKMEVYSDSISITGFLIGKSDEELIFKISPWNYYLPISEIIEIEETSNKSFDAEDLIEVRVKIKGTAKIIIQKTILASKLPKSLGAKPLVYEIPSGSDQFKIAIEDYTNEHNKWLEATKLAEHTDLSISTPTPYLSSKPTVTQTRTTNNDTQSDSQTDYETDWKTDEDSSLALSSTPTPFLSSKPTVSQTRTTNNDTQTDSQTDYETDWKTDEDNM